MTSAVQKAGDESEDWHSAVRRRKRNEVAKPRLPVRKNSDWGKTNERNTNRKEKGEIGKWQADAKPQNRD